MAIIKTGEKLVKKTFFAEKEDWDRLIAMANKTDKSVGLYLRELIATGLKRDEVKMFMQAGKNCAVKPD